MIGQAEIREPNQETWRVPITGITALDEEPANGFEQTVMDQLYEGVYFVDPARRIRYWNLGAERLTGFSASDVVGRFCHDNILNHVDDQGTPLCRTRCPLAASMQDGRGREADVFLRHRQGHRVQVRVRTSAVREREGRTIGGVEIFDDKTELSAAHRQVSELRDLAMTDQLTGIPNRRHFDMALRSRIAEFAGYDRPFGLLIADLDRFKVLNDTHGHAAGDLALRTVSRTMLEASRASDDLARIGGEEFGITVPDIGPSMLRAIADRMCSLVGRTSVRADGRDLAITVSIGGAIAIAGDTPETIFKRADRALYAAKEEGRNRVVIA